MLCDILSPEDIKTLSTGELQELALSIRKRIMEVLSITGGHLSSNLGVVELTLALHVVFDSPKDPFIFDVSHQTYVHKLLTGRNHLFPKLRQYQGLCGFAHPKESPHDPFFAGHAGTALSLALGMAKSRDLSQKENHVISVLGDASLTCGLTLEALNNISPDLSRFVVILNDNDRSISENVGNIKNVLHQTPETFFQQFSLKYVGSVDGHDLESLVYHLKAARDARQPILLHVETIKGKGMSIAIDNPTPYHGARPFDLCSGKFLPSPTKAATFPKIFGRHVLNMADRDPSLVAITPAMPAGSCLEEFLQKYPARCLDVGIAEGHAVTFAGGIAADPTKKVIACIYATFLQRAFDNLFHDVCMQELPVLFALDRAFISGPDGSTHHGIYDIAFLNAMPNMVIAQPRNGHLLKELLESAFSWRRPTALRYPNTETEEPNLPLMARELGKGEVLASGETILLIGLGECCNTALRVRELLLEAGLSATVVDPVFVKPLDEQLFHILVPNHFLVVTIEEHAVSSGLGVILNSFLMQNGYKNPVLNIGIPDRYIQFGKREELLKEIGLDPESIAERVMNYVNCSVS